MFYSIQYLRALAAMMVVLTHMAHKLESNSINFLGDFWIGAYGVDLFFIISGFIMTNTVSGKKSRPLMFIVARFKRILPLYWILTLVSLFIYLYNPLLINSSGGVTDVFSSFLLIPTGGKYLINNGWTLTYEFLFYFIFSLCMLVNYKVVFCFFILLLLSLIGFAVRIENVYLYPITSPLLIEFALGIFAFWIVKKEFINFLFANLFIFFGLSLLVYQYHYGGYLNDFERIASGGLPMLFLFLGVVSLEAKITTKLKKILNPIFIIGMSSYSLYLFHPFILAAITIFFKFFGIVDLSLVYFGVMCVSSIFSGYFLYRWVEVPIANYLRYKA